MEKGEGSEGAGGILDSDFIPLDDLVYAPLHALVKSNLQLQQSVVEAIKNAGTVKQDGQEEVIHLNNMNIAYDRVKSESEEGYSVESLQLQVPLLSIVPVANLNVESAKIEFSTEIRAVNEGQERFKVNGRICSPSQRETDFLPKVSYEMQIRSVPATEGLQRLTDVLSANQVAKQIDAAPVATDGNLRSEEQKEVWQVSTEMKAQVKKLNTLYAKISQMMEEQERLQQISASACPGDTYRYDKEKYQKLQSDITNEIMKLKETILEQEVELSKGRANG